MDKNTLSKYLWDLTNIITGFAIVQTISLTYACGTPEFSVLINRCSIKATISFHLFFVSLGECYAIWWCSKKIITLLNKKEIDEISEITKIINHAAWGRIIVIIILFIPNMLAVWARQLIGMPFNP
jgi:hypothetical protein